MAIKKKTPTSKSKPSAKKPSAKKPAAKAAPKRAAPKKAAAKAAPKRAAPKAAAKAAPKKAAAAKAAPKRAAPKAAAKSESSATAPTRTAGVKKTPAKKAAIRASSATVLKRAGKKLGARGSSTTATTKKPASKKTKASDKTATGATKRAEGLVAKVKKARVPRELPTMVNEESLAIARRAATLAAEKKANDVVLIDVCGRTSYTDYLVVASAETERQVASIAQTIEVTLKGEGHRVISSEGHTPGQWILLDYGGAVIHLFTDEARPFYDLEGMWPDAKRESVV